MRGGVFAVHFFFFCCYSGLIYLYYEVESLKKRISVLLFLLYHYITIVFFLSLGRMDMYVR